MSSIDRSRALIEEALDLLDTADDIERRIHGGETVTVTLAGSGETLRGESALPRLDTIRESAALPLLASAALNAERIAGALEALVELGGREGRADLAEYSAAELSAELAGRLNHEDRQG